MKNEDDIASTGRGPLSDEQKESVREWHDEAKTSAVECPKCGAAVKLEAQTSFDADKKLRMGDTEELRLSLPPDAQKEINEWFQGALDESGKPGTWPSITLKTYPEFRVIFIKQVHSCYADSSTTDAWMFRERLLPFAPQLKMVFTLPDEWIARARKVQWDGELFVVYTMPDQTIYDLQANKKLRGPSLDQLIEMWRQEHWELLGYGAHPPIETLKDNGEKEKNGEA